MTQMQRFGCAMTAIVALLSAASAQAFFPPPVPVGVSGGEIPPNPPPPTPTVPTLPPDVFKPPPSSPPPIEKPPPVITHHTPEPATMISALVGVAIFGGYALRRRMK